MQLYFISCLCSYGQDIFVEDSLLTAQEINQKSIDALGRLSITTQNILQAEKYATQQLLFAKKINYSSGIADAYLNLGNIYQHQKNHYTALSYLLKALILAEDLDDKLQIGKICNTIANCYYFIQHYSLAIPYYQKALLSFQTTNNQPYLALIYRNIGLAYKEQKSYDLALFYYKQAISITEKLNTHEDLADLNEDIGLIYVEKKEFKKSLKYYQLAFTIRETQKDTSSLIYSYTNIGEVLLRQKKYIDAKQYLQKAVTLAKKINFQDEVLYETYTLLGEVYLSEQDYPTALINLHTAENLKIFNKDKALLKTYTKIAETYTILNNPHEANIYQAKYIDFKQEIDQRNKEANIYAKKMLKSIDEEIYKFKVTQANSNLFIKPPYQLAIVLFLILLIVKSIWLYKKHTPIPFAFSAKTSESQAYESLISDSVVNLMASPDLSLTSNTSTLERDIAKLPPPIISKQLLYFKSTPDIQYLLVDQPQAKLHHVNKQAPAQHDFITLLALHSLALAYEWQDNYLFESLLAIYRYLLGEDFANDPIKSATYYTHLLSITSPKSQKLKNLFPNTQDSLKTSAKIVLSIAKKWYAEKIVEEKLQTYKIRYGEDISLDNFNFLAFFREEIEMPFEKTSKQDIINTKRKNEKELLEIKENLAYLRKYEKNLETFDYLILHYKNLGYNFASSLLPMEFYHLLIKRYPFIYKKRKEKGWPHNLPIENFVMNHIPYYLGYAKLCALIDLAGAQQENNFSLFGYYLHQYHQIFGKDLFKGTLKTKEDYTQAKENYYVQFLGEIKE